MTTNKYVLGVDIGGSHITAAVMDMESRLILEDSYTRCRIDAHGKPATIINNWKAAIDLAYGKAGLEIDKIGIAMPGPFDYENGISHIAGNDKYEAFYGLNVKEMLAGALGIEAGNILMKNDAACFLAGEMFAGAVKDYANVIGITLGTGLGSAVAAYGNTRDANLWCSSFQDGIAEDYLSTRWFLKRYYQLTGVNIIDVKSLTELYDESETIRTIFDEFSQHLAAFLMLFLQDTEADVIVLGGNISNAWPRFLPNVLKAFKANSIEVPLRISELKERAAIAGAASCWENLAVTS
ncbi:ROK family protein [Pedobacter sp. HDW13]|uniref:ROK family protein n=1 Tax=Pedobacter sp. HDW13 TaxID=2714940 RepID=UPI00140E9378|nr:ROK family protein [Pedobacter sp. HDW13]QIL42254.1 ROK family protein [Pedobacter sp. HDW13]